MKKLTFLILFFVSLRLCSASIEWPPFDDANDWYEYEEHDLMGIVRLSRRDSTIGARMGKIHHRVRVLTSVVGAIQVDVKDGIKCPFTVSDSGLYSIAFRGHPSGEFLNASFEGKGGGRLYLDAQITEQSNRVSSVSRYILCHTDYSVGDTLSEIARRIIWALIDPKGIFDTWYAIASLVEPQERWSPQEDKFSIVVTTHLERDHLYSWQFYVDSWLGSAALGGTNLAEFDVDVTLEQVTVTLVDADAHSPVLYNPRVTPASGVAGFTPFEYLVDYDDVDGDEPNYIRVYIGDSPHDMHLKSGTAASGTYHYVTTLSGGEYEYSFETMDVQNGFNNTATLAGPSVNPGSGDALSKQGDQWNELSGDGDHVPEAGERIGIRVRLESNCDVTDVEASLSSSTSGVNITKNDLTYGDIEAAERKWPGDYAIAEFNFSETKVCNFMLHVTYVKDTVSYFQDIPFSRTIYEDGAIAPFFEVVSVITYETSNGDGDGIPQSGEFVDFDIDLRNIGTANAYDVRARVTNVNVGHVGENWQEYFDISQGNTGRGQHPFGFSGDGIPTNFTGWVFIDLDIEAAGGYQQHIDNADIFVAQPKAWMSAYPQEWNFGVTGTSNDIVKAFTIANNGSADLNITNISVTHPNDTSTSWDGNPFSKMPGDSQSIDVTIETSSLSGLIERQVIITHNGGLQNTDRVVITGLVSDVPAAHQLPNVTGAAEYVDCYGDTIVWADTRNGGWDIYAYDLSTQTEIPICTDSNVQDTPRIDGDIIAWRDRRNSVGEENPDIYAYDMSIEQEIVVSTDSAYERLVGVGDGKIAYIRIYYQSGSPWDGASNLYIYDVASETTTNVTNFTPGGTIESIRRPDWDCGDFSDNVLTWQEGTYTPPSMWTNPRIMKLVDSSPVHIGTVLTIGPRTNDGKITWTDYDDWGRRQVWLWDGTSRQITTEPVDHGNNNLAIGTEIIAYDKSGLYPRLFAWDLATSTEFLAAETVWGQSARMDGHLLAWSYGGKVYYTFLNEADIAVSSADIIFSDDQPLEGDTIDVNVTVHNLNPWDTSEDITVRLYDNNPHDPNAQLGSDAVIAAGIEAQGNALVTFNDVLVSSEGPRIICARLEVPESDNPANNIAYKMLIVGDTDTQGPAISNISVQEFGGDGDGAIEDDEQILITWQATDVSGVDSTWCKIEGADYFASGSYYVVLRSQPPGDYDLSVLVNDGDATTQVSTYDDSFSVFATCDLNEDGLVNNYDFATLGLRWLDSDCTAENKSCGRADVDNSTRVDFNDFSRLVGKWLTLSVNNVNRAPVFAAIGDKSVTEGSLLSFSVSAIDPDGDAIEYSAVNLPSGAVFANQTFTWTPGDEQAGVYSVTFIASDGQDQDSQTITITVNNINIQPPL